MILAAFSVAASRKNSALEISRILAASFTIVQSRGFNRSDDICDKGIALEFFPIF